MFKSSPFSFLWGSSTKSQPLKEQKPSSPQAFTISGKGANLVKVSMVDTESEVNGEDGFVDIQCRKLSYAEVASLRRHEPQPAIPAKGRIEKNEFEVLRDEPDNSTPPTTTNSSSSYHQTYTEEELPEKFKTNNHFKNKKQKKGKKSSK